MLLSGSEMVDPPGAMERSRFEQFYADIFSVDTFLHCKLYSKSVLQRTGTSMLSTTNVSSLTASELLL